LERHARQVKNYRRALRRSGVTPPPPERKRQKKELKKPLKAKTAYQIFSIDYRKLIQARSPDFSKKTLTEKASMIKQEWSTLTDVDRESFDQASREDLERYKTEMAKFEASAGKKGKGKGKGQGRPLTGYFIFLREERLRMKRENLPQLAAVDQSKIFGEKWNKLADEEKAAFKQRGIDEFVPGASSNNKRHMPVKAKVHNTYTNL
jgi:hypothetical protein